MISYAMEAPCAGQRISADREKGVLFISVQGRRLTAAST
jgi:hypothetical protein